MKLLFVTDNGFCENNGSFYYSGPNVAHINNLKSFFDSFIVVAREDAYSHGYHKVLDNIEVNLVPAKRIDILCRVIKKKIVECDAVICYGTNGFFASKIGAREGKVVISYNGGDPYDFCISRGTLKGRALAPIARYMCKQSFNNSDFGHYCDDFLFDRYPAKGKMLACSGVDIECDKRVLLNRLKKIDSFQKTGDIKLGLIGHTNNSLKGIDLAIEAVSSLSENYFLEVVGRGPTDHYMELARDLGCEKRISFLGTLAPGDELMTWLDSVDVYLQPSRIEGLPRATIEAMSRGCPIVSSDVGALTKLVDNEFVFSINHAFEMKDLILKISDIEQMKTQANRNFENSRKYERTERDKKYNVFYTEVIKEIERRNS